MNNEFDELAKALAQSITRRQALRRFSVGLAGVVLASLGLANKAHASKCIDEQCFNEVKKYCADFYKRNSVDWDACVDGLGSACFRDCGI